ncbi:hypothetical protein ES703_25609 [subsurface metagenome]
MRKLAKWLVGIVLGLVVMVAILAILLPSIFAPGLAIVYSASMAPAMPAGSLAITEPVDPTTIEVGDIIAFNPPWDEDVTVSHRVVEILSTGFVTKGDANEDPDPFVIPEENVIGQVSFHIPYVGYPLVEIRRFASSVWGFCLLIVLPSMVIFGSAARDMNFKYSPGKKRARVLKKREDRLKKRGHRRR